MGYTLYYAAQNLSEEDVQNGILYLLRSYDHALFEHSGSTGSVVLNPRRDVPVEGLKFPPPERKPGCGFIKTNQQEPETGHVKELLAGLERILHGKFAARDDYGWSVGSKQLRKELSLAD